MGRVLSVQRLEEEEKGKGQSRDGRQAGIYTTRNPIEPEDIIPHKCLTCDCFASKTRKL